MRIHAGVRQALDEVIATGRTRRWNLDQCNNQEKAYVGVNLENILRDALELPPGRPLKPDFEIAGVDVDCKWTRNWGGWQIPNEALDEVCLLVYGDDLEDEIAIGLIRIRDDLLVGGNRDQKRTIQRPAGLDEVRWLTPQGAGLPENFLMNLRKEDRDAILAPKGGDARARELFKRCEGLVIHRHTIESIGQQLDDARRFRGETRAALLDEGFEVFNGHWKAHKSRAEALGGPVPQGSAQWVCLRSDGSTTARRALMEPMRVAEAAEYRREMKRELRDQRKGEKQLRDTQKALLAEVERQNAVSDLETMLAVAIAETRAVEVAEQLIIEIDFEP